MNCPVCGEQMVVKDFDGVAVDVCETGCRGLWFDCGELARLDEENEGAGKAIQQALSNPRILDAHRGQLDCPRCGIPMQVHKYKHCKDVKVDECYACGGIFLDSGELKVIKQGFMSDEQREQYLENATQNLQNQVGDKYKIRVRALGQLGKLLSQERHRYDYF